MAIHICLAVEHGIGNVLAIFETLGNFWKFKVGITVTSALLKLIKTTKQLHFLKMSKRRFSKTNPLAEKNVSDFDNVFKKRIDKEVKDCFCPHCGKKLAQKESLKIHISNFHEKIKHQCVHCKKEFSQRSSLITHISNIHENRGHRCSNCKIIFTQRSSLSTHFKNVHEGVKYECKLCGALKNSKSILWNHMKSYHESEITKSVDKFEIKDANLELNPIVKLDLISRPVVPRGTAPYFGRSVNPISTKGGRLCPPNNTGTPGFSDIPTALRSITRMAEKLIPKQKQFHRTEIDSEIEEHCDETLLKKEELKSQVSESDDDDIPDFETENQIELSVGNKIRCFKKDYEVESKEFNKVFDIKKEVQREPTENSVDNSSEEVANTQSKFKQVSTKMKENQNQILGDITESIEFLKDIIFEEPNEDVTKIKVEPNQDIKVEQNQDIKFEQNQEIKVEQNQEIEVKQNQEIKGQQNQEFKLEQNQETSELKSIGSNDQEPVPLKITFFTCILCLNKYGSPEDVEKHLSIFHKISVEFQEQIFKTGCFT